MTPDIKIWKVGPYEEWANNKGFGELLAYWRQMANLSRAQAAQSLDLSSEYIRLIEHGLRTPAEGQMHLILELYKVEYTRVQGRWVIGTNAFEFTSRIRGARNRTPKHPQADISKGLTRQERLGLIVELLPQVTDRTLKQVYEKLERSRKNHAI